MKPKITLMLCPDCGQEECLCDDLGFDQWSEDNKDIVPEPHCPH